MQWFSKYELVSNGQIIYTGRDLFAAIDIIRCDEHGGTFSIRAYHEGKIVEYWTVGKERFK